MSEIELLPINLNLESELLEHLVVPDSVMALYRSRFQTELIAQDDPEERLIARTFEFVMGWVQQYGEPPTPDVIQAEISEIKFDQPNVPIDYLVQAFRKRYSEIQVQNALIRLSENAVEDPATTARMAMNEFQQILRITEDRRTVIDLSDADWMIDRYVDMVAHGDSVGYSFGWNKIDEALGGIRKGGLYFVIGRPKRYKSWFLLKSAVENARDGIRVAFFTLEMGMEEMFQRAMCMFAGMPWNGFMKGELSQSHIDDLRSEMAILAPCDNFFMLHPPLGERDVPSLLRQATELQADVVYIDQLKFIESYRAGSRDARWQQVEYVCEDLKEASHTLPFYVAAQFNREAANLTEMADLSKIGLSDSIGQTADMLLGLYMNKEMKESRIVEFGTIESRSFEHARWHIKIELNKNCSFGQPQKVTEA